MFRYLFNGAAYFTALFLLIGCVATKKNHANRLILQGADSLQNALVNVPEPVIQKGDLLTILVYSDNQEATEIYNQPQGGGGSGAAPSTGGATLMSLTGRGYKVDNNGQIYVHAIGLMDVAGLTKKQVADKITLGLQPVLKNPYVVIRNVNNRITILGEVLRPGQIELPDQKISILDAIGLAGDMSPYGRRDNVLIAREVDGKRVFGRVDLRKADVYNSPYFYLQQNDMVYIEPNRKKPTGNEQVLLRNVTIAASLLSVVTLIITLIK